MEQLNAALRAERNKNSALKGGFLIFNEKNYAECLLFLWKNDIILTMDYLLNLLAKFLAVIIVLTLHEFAHAFTAYKCGDPTAKWSGRMTLNPLKHFDPIGAVLFAFTGFGWAKPVPINPDNFKNRVWGSFFTSIAGVFVNYLFAFLTFPIYVLAANWCYGATELTYGMLFLNAFTYCLFAYSMSFCIFNLLPFYPLDGFNAIDAFTKKRGKVYMFLRRYGYYVLLGLIIWSMACDWITVLAPFDVLGYVMSFATNVLGKPIIMFWNLIF